MNGVPKTNHLKRCKRLVLLSQKRWETRVSHEYDQNKNCTIYWCQNITKHSLNYCGTRKHLDQTPILIFLWTTTGWRSLKMSPDLSWCHCRSWPCCRPTTPDHRARRSRVKGPSVAALVLLRHCRAAGAYKSPARLPGPAAGCASSSVVHLFKEIHIIQIWYTACTQSHLDTLIRKSLCILLYAIQACCEHGVLHVSWRQTVVQILGYVLEAKYLSVWWNSPPAEAAPRTSWPQNLQAPTAGWAAP